MDKSEVIEILQDQIETVHRCQEGADKFSDLFGEAKTRPIPFSGNVRNAEVLTIGANASNREFEDGDLKGDVDDAGKLYDLQTEYFEEHRENAYAWFKTWFDALEHLDASYRRGDEKNHLAAHLDLSPRATIPWSSLDTKRQRPLFKQMVEQDLKKWFFDLLPFYENACLLILAGSVPKYVNGFVSRNAKDGWKLYDPEKPNDFIRADGSEIGYYRLSSPGGRVDLPVFYTSIGPSAQTKKHREKFMSRIRNNSERLKEIIRKCE